MGSSRNQIDMEVDMDGTSKLRVIGYYGYPESTRRSEAWAMLIQLSQISMLPWVCIGDFNDLLDQSEKRGTQCHPP